MTIKEAESLTGMPRASIRFYEAEGLIEPRREKNGYRIYTQEHVDVLLRIRLLRTLDVSVEEIRELTAGRLALADCLRQHMARLEEAQVKAARSAEVCRQLMDASADFQTLDAELWLSRLESPQASDVPERAMPPKPGILRRVLARGFDSALYVLLWELLLTVLFRVNLTEGITKSPTLVMQLLENAAVMVCIMLFEPLFLRWWGTTPGKWVMGISVTDDKGKRLSYRDALSRCGMLLLYGYGLCIPILVVVRQVKSLMDIRQGEEPEWEWDSRLQLQNKSRVRAAVLYVVCAVLLLVSQEGVRGIPEIPPNRGELTIAEFAENFNAVQRYYEKGSNHYIIDGDMRELSAGIPWELDAAGHWVGRDDNDFYAWIYQGEPPAITLHTGESGAVSGVTLSFRTSWKAGSDSDTARRGRVFQKHIFLMRVALQAFGRAVIEGAEFGGWRAVQDVAANGWRESSAFVYRNIAVSYDVDFSGCTPMENGAPRLEETLERCAVAYTFTVQRTN